MNLRLTLAGGSVALAIALSAAQGQAQDSAHESISQSELEALLQVKARTVETLAFHPKLVAAVKQQNAQQLSMDVIQQRDQRWQEGDRRLRRDAERSVAGRVLRHLVRTNSALTQAFVTDNQGANVGTYPATSDYWQGDEEKWTAAFHEGNGKAYIGPVEIDESTNQAQVQVSAPILDHNRQAIGVLIVGVSVDYVNTQMNDQDDS